MGMWVILIGDDNLTLERFQKMRFAGCKEIILSEHQLDILYENDYAVLYEDADCLEAYDSSELERLPFRDVHTMILKYSDIQVLRAIVGAEDFPEDVIIDCDGLDLGLEEIVKKERLWNTELIEHMQKKYLDTGFWEKFDFTNGEIQYMETDLDEEMLMVDYPHDLTLNAGFVSDIFYIRIFWDCNWHSPVAEYLCRTEVDFEKLMHIALEQVKKEIILDRFSYYELWETIRISYLS